MTRQQDPALDTMREVVNQVLSAYDSEGGYRSAARAEILIHSVQVFARRGLQRTTVQDLLDASGISRRTFYKYFSSKFDVLENIYRIFVENMILRFREQLSHSATLIEIIRNTTGIYFDYHLSMGPVIRLMMEEARSSDSPLAPYRERGQTLAVEILGSELRRLTGRHLDPLVLRHLLWSLENFSIHLLQQPGGAVDAAELDRCKRLMCGIAESVVLGETDPAMLAP